MNGLIQRQGLRQAIQPKFRGHEQLKCKSRVLYPEGAEREFIRLTDAYMQTVSRVVKSHLQELKEAIYTEQKASTRHDSLTDSAAKIRSIFAQMYKEVEKETEKFGLYSNLASLAILARKMNYKEWKKAVKSTLGVDLLDDYYLGEFYREQVEAWVRENVSKIKMIPQDALTTMEDIVMQGFRGGKTSTAILKKLQDAYEMEKRSARLIARDQLGTLNRQLTQAQQTQAGVEEYYWSTAGDSRVRDRHRQLNKNLFRWNDPPVIDTRTGRKGHPGDDYQCRCIALPKFKLDSLNLILNVEGIEKEKEENRRRAEARKRGENHA